jgi:hypothetical protein
MSSTGATPYRNHSHHYPKSAEYRPMKRVYASGLASNDTAPPYRGPPFAGDRLDAGNIYVAERFVVSVLGLLRALGG